METWLHLAGKVVQSGFVSDGRVNFVEVVGIFGRRCDSHFGDRTEIWKESV
jgi:hypothetical protein